MPRRCVAVPGLFDAVWKAVVWGLCDSKGPLRRGSVLLGKVAPLVGRFPPPPVPPLFWAPHTAMPFHRKREGRGTMERLGRDRAGTRFMGRRESHKEAMPCVVGRGAQSAPGVQGRRAGEQEPQFVHMWGSRISNHADFVPAVGSLQDSRFIRTFNFVCCHCFCPKHMKGLHTLHACTRHSVNLFYSFARKSLGINTPHHRIG